MSADKDYVRLRELLLYFIKSERSPKQARGAIFYTYVSGSLDHVVIGENEKESRVMKQVRKRYFEGKGNAHEPTKFYEYFYRKFRKEIQETREKLTGFPYSKKQRIG